MLLSLREDVPDEDDELVQVRLRFGRQADHRVDLDEVPAAGEGDVGRRDHVGIGEGLVDHAPQAVGARFRREREAGLADLRDGVGEPDGEGLRAQRREGDRDTAVRELRGEAFHQRLDLRVVGGREGEEPDLAPPRLRDELRRHLGDVAGIELAHRAIPVAGLAEAASLRAAAHDLQAEAVLDDLDGRHHGLLGVVLGLQDGHPGPLCPLGRPRVVSRNGGDPAVRVVRDVVEGGDIDPVDRRELGQEVAARESARARVAVGVEHPGQRLLGVADEERVEEVRERLGVGRARPAAEHVEVGRRRE